MTATGDERKVRKFRIERLNILLRLAQKDLALLDDGEFKKLLEEICLAVFWIRPRNSEDREHIRRLVTRASLRKLQRVLEPALENFTAKPTALEQAQGRVFPAEFKMAESELTIIPDPDGERFAVLHSSDDFPTRVYITLADILKDTKPSELLRCSHCDTLFVPLRRPDKGAPAYCGVRCASVVMSRNYRQRQAEKRKRRKRRKPEKKIETGGRCGSVSRPS